MPGTLALVALLSLAADDKPVVPPEPEYECKFEDGSVVVVTLTEASVVVQSKFGKLTVPLAEVKKLEMGFRYPDGVEAKVRQAVEDLGSPDFSTRDAAQKTLVGVGEYAVPLVRTGLKSPVPEVAERCGVILKKVTASLSDEKSDPTLEDVITTDEMVIRGKITSDTFKAKTRHFGEVTVKLVDLRELRPLGGKFIGTFAVDATRHAAPGWKTFFDTGLDVEKGQPLSITATGKIDQNLRAPGTNTTGPGGTGAPARWWGRVGVQNQLGGGLSLQPGGYQQSFSAGTLYGRIGATGTLFKIGEGVKVSKAAESGRLYLVIAPSSFGGESKGEYEVKVKLGK